MYNLFISTADYYQFLRAVIKATLVYKPFQAAGDDFGIYKKKETVAYPNALLNHLNISKFNAAEDVDTIRIDIIIYHYYK